MRWTNSIRAITMSIHAKYWHTSEISHFKNSRPAVDDDERAENDSSRTHKITCICAEQTAPMLQWCTKPCLALEWACSSSHSDILQILHAKVPLKREKKRGQPMMVLWIWRIEPWHRLLWGLKIVQSDEFDISSLGANSEIVWARLPLKIDEGPQLVRRVAGARAYETGPCRSVHARLSRARVRSGASARTLIPGGWEREGERGRGRGRESWSDAWTERMQAQRPPRVYTQGDPERVWCERAHNRPGGWERERVCVCVRNLIIIGKFCIPVERPARCRCGVTGLTEF